MSEQEWEDKLAEVQKHSEHWYNKYKELENKIADIKANCDLAIEGREVKIKELEQENNKLLDVINNQDVKIADLETENAELKRLRCCENCKNVSLQLHWKESKEIDERRQFVCGTCGNRKHWEYLGKTVGITETQQLTKAREIIKGLLPMASNFVFGTLPKLDEEVQIYRQAEQFLKDLEKVK